MKLSEILKNELEKEAHPELTSYEKIQIEAVTALVRATNAEVQAFLKS